MYVFYKLRSLLNLKNKLICNLAECEKDETSHSYQNLVMTLSINYFKVVLPLMNCTTLFVSRWGMFFFVLLFKIFFTGKFYPEVYSISYSLLLVYYKICCWLLFSGGWDCTYCTSHSNKPPYLTVQTHSNCGTFSLVYFVVTQLYNLELEISLCFQLKILIFAAPFGVQWPTWSWNWRSRYADWRFGGCFS